MRDGAVESVPVQRQGAEVVPIVDLIAVGVVFTWLTVIVLHTRTIQMEVQRREVAVELVVVEEQVRNLRPALNVRKGPSERVARQVEHAQLGERAARDMTRELV